MRVGIDIMGGDFAPEAPVLGSLAARDELPDDVEIVFVGNKHIIEKFAEEKDLDISSFSIIHTPDVVEMADHPLKSFSRKPEASIFLGQKLVKIAILRGKMSSLRMLNGMWSPIWDSG